MIWPVPRGGWSVGWQPSQRTLPVAGPDEDHKSVRPACAWFVDDAEDPSSPSHRSFATPATFLAQKGGAGCRSLGSIRWKSVHSLLAYATGRSWKDWTWSASGTIHRRTFGSVLSAAW